VKDAVAELLVTMANAEKSPPLGPPVVRERERERGSVGMLE
jgi:hypothetical protein